MGRIQKGGMRRKIGRDARWAGRPVMYIGHVCVWRIYPPPGLSRTGGAGGWGRWSEIVQKTVDFGGPPMVYNGILQGAPESQSTPKYPLFLGTQKLKSEKSHQSTTTTPNFYYYYYWW